MTSALSAAFQPEAHPHAPPGTSTGGQFTDAGNTAKKAATNSAKSAMSKSRRRTRPARKADDGTLSYDSSSNHGTGYDNADGDPRVHALQEKLTSFGITDSSGKPLKKDGKLGPKTTSAVKALQTRLGLKADGKVTPALLGQIKSMKTLPAAAKKTVHAAASHALRDVELARPGEWKLASGDVTFTDEMLRDAADFFTASGGQAVPVKLGHSDSRFNGDGEPAFGSVTNVRYLEDDRGPVLLGDIVDMPEWLGASAPKRWPNRSIEGWQNFQYGGREYSLILSGLAFLGVTPPGVRNIKSLADLQVALAASSATRLVASAPTDDPAEPPDDDEEDEELDDEDLEEDDEDEPDDTAPIPQDPAPALPAGASHIAAQAAARIHNARVRGAGMNLAKYREALAGLPDDASEQDVGAALAAAGLASSTQPTEGVAASSAQGAATAARGGLITIDPAQLEQFNAAMVRAAALDERLKKQDRDTTITDAVKAGKFPPARRPHYEKLWDVDPVGTKEVIASLAGGLIPVTASGYDTNAEDTFTDVEYEHLFPPVRREASRG